MSVVAILRAVPIATNAESMEPEGVTHFEMYERDALYPRPGTDLTDIPVRIDHDKSTSIGQVTGLRDDICVGGPRGRWQYVHVEIDDPPPWLRRGTPVSISRAAHRSRTPWDADWLLVQKAILTEVSLLSPGNEPAHPAACVEWLDEKKPSPAAVRASSERSAAGEVIHGGRLIRREFRTAITFRSARGEVIRNEPNGSQTIWASEADYRQDVNSGQVLGVR